MLRIDSTSEGKFPHKFHVIHLTNSFRLFKSQDHEESASFDKGGHDTLFGNTKFKSFSGSGQEIVLFSSVMLFVTFKMVMIPGYCRSGFTATVD